MKKIKRLAVSALFAGAFFCVTPVLSSGFLPYEVMAADEVFTIESGDSFDVSAVLKTGDYSFSFTEADIDHYPLSESNTPDGSGESYLLELTLVVYTPGEHELVISDGDGNTIKTVSVIVTEEDTDPESGDGEDIDDGETDPADGGDTDSQSDESSETDNSDDPVYNLDLVNFVPSPDGEISGTTESGEMKTGEKITLKGEPHKGYALRNWVIRNLDGKDITKELGLTEDGTFIIPDYPVMVSAEFEYYLIHEVELLDVTEVLEPGKPVKFTGHVKDNTDHRFFLLAEIWINEYDTKGITNSDDINKTIRDKGISLLETVDAGDKYNYSVMFMTTEGYEFADDIKLIYKGKEYKPTKDIEIEGKETVAFNGFLSFGEQKNPKEKQKKTNTVTREETKTEYVTQYVYKTYTYTTYKYITRTVPAGGTKRVTAAFSGDTNNVGIWIALAIAAGGGVVSGILVGRKRKKRK